MTHPPEKLYLDLMKKALSFSMWPEPPVRIETYDYLRSPVKRIMLSALSRVLKPTSIRLFQESRVSDAQRVEGRTWPGYADTMIGLKRLDNLQSCVETVLKEGIPGDFIETGVWRGGACILIRAVLAAYGVDNRRVFVADSFQGLPKPEPDKYPVDKGDSFHIHSVLSISQDDVKNNFRKYGLLDDQVVFLKGWFKDTLPSAPIETLAVLRLDGDMYGSTIEALTNLYPKLAKGGFCIIDDYDVFRCKQAVDDYRAEHNINTVIEEIDWTGVYWRKE